MIFKTIENEITRTNTSIGLFGLTLNEIQTNLQNIKNRGLINTIFNTSSIDSTAVAKYNTEIEKGTAAQEALKIASKNTNKETIALMESTNGATVTANRLTEAQKASTLAAKAHSVAMTAASVAANAVVGLGISLAIGAIVSGVDNLIHRAERLAEAAEEARNNIKDTKSSFDNLKSSTNEITPEFAELSQHVDQGTGKPIDLSTEDYERFLELSNQLADTLPNVGYTIDENGNKIVNLKGNVNEITDSINQLVQAEQLASNQKIDASLDDVFDESISKLQTYDGKLSSLKENSGELVEDTYETVQKLLNGQSIKFDINNETNSQLFSKIKDMFDQEVGFNLKYEFGEMSLDDNSKSWVSTLTDDELTRLKTSSDAITQKYSDMRSTIADEIAATQNNIQTELNGLSQYLNSWLVTDFDYNTIISSYGTEMGTAIQSAIGTINWVDLGIDNWADAKKWIQDNLLNVLKDVENNDIREAFISLFTDIDLPIDSAINYLEAIQKYYEENGLTLPISFEEKQKEIQNVKSQFDARNESFTGDTKSLDNFFQENGINTEAEYNKWLKVTNGITDATEAMNAWEKENMKSEASSHLTFSEAFNSSDFSNEKEELLNLAKAGELSEDTISSNEEYSALITKTGLSADAVARKINKMVSSADQLSAMKTGISGISNILAQKQENLSNESTAEIGIDADVLANLPDSVKACKSEYNNFVKILGNGKSKMSACKKAANQLANAFLNSNNFLANLDETNKKSYVSMLKNMGIMNAEAVVQEALNQKIDDTTASKIDAALASYNLADGVSNTEANALSSETAWLATASEQAQQYYIKKLLANSNALDTSSSVNNLITLVGQIDSTCKAYDLLVQYQIELSKFENMMKNGQSYTSDELAKQDQKVKDLKSKIEDTSKTAKKLCMITTNYIPLTVIALP